MGQEQIAVDPRNRRRCRVDRTAGWTAELRRPVGTINLKVLYRGRRNAKALVEFLEHVVVDQGQADVFVATPLALLGVHFA